MIQGVKINRGAGIERGAWSQTVTPSASAQNVIIPEGHHNGQGKVIVLGVQGLETNRTDLSCTIEWETIGTPGFGYSEKFLCPITPVVFSYRTKGYNADSGPKGVTYTLEGATDKACSNWSVIASTGNIDTPGNHEENAGKDWTSYNGNGKFYQLRIRSQDPSRGNPHTSYISLHQYKMYVSL